MRGRRKLADTAGEDSLGQRLLAICDCLLSEKGDLESPRRSPSPNFMTCWLGLEHCLSPSGLIFLRLTSNLK